VPDQTEHQILAAQFARARVPLRLAEAGFAPGVTEQRIVQMDVRRTTRRGRVREEIHLWPGEASELRVLGIDPRLQQLVLLVHEPERQFTVRRWKRGRVYHDVVRRTSALRRRFLLGMDECHLFIAPLRGPVTTVRDAHAELQPPPVVEARRRGARVRRQGEWFFLPITSDERRAVAAHVGDHGVERGGGLGNPGRRGRPHVAAERVRVPVRDEGGRLLATHEYARGRVVHPDHHAIFLRDWMRVEPNTEDRGPVVPEHRISRWVD
jgi:hypothetical protein